MAERSIASVLKTERPERVSGVRIPLSPPIENTPGRTGWGCFFLVELGCAAGGVFNWRKDRALTPPPAGTRSGCGGTGPRRWPLFGRPRGSNPSLRHLKTTPRMVKVFFGTSVEIDICGTRRVTAHRGFQLQSAMNRKGNTALCSAAFSKSVIINGITLIYMF